MRMASTFNVHPLLAVSVTMLSLVLSSVELQAQFTVHNNGALVTVTSGCIATIKTGDFVNDAGTVNNAGRITVEGNLVNNDVVTGAGAATGIFSVRDNWENNQTFVSDQSLVVLNGGNQNITGSTVTSFHNLTLSGSGIKSLTLDANVLGTLQLGGLELATQTNTLHVQNPSAAAINAGGGFVSSVGNGRLAWDMNSTMTRVFPLGSSVGTPRIRPVAITPLSASPHTFAARLGNVNPTSEGFDVNTAAADLCTVNDEFFHLINRITGTDAADVTQYFIAGLDGNWERGGHWQNVPQWEQMGASTQGVSGPYTTLTTGSWNDFSSPAFGLVNLAPQVSMAQLPESVCLSGSPVNLSANPSGGTFSGPGVVGSLFMPSSAGIGSHEVTYSYTAANGCMSTAVQTVEVYEQPTVAITALQNPPYQICAGQSITLNATPGFSSYIWSNSQTGPSIVVGNSGNYTVTAQSANGCSATSTSVNVTVNPLPAPVISANGPLSFCAGGSVILSTSPGFGSYSWSNGGTNLSTTITQSGSYTVTVTNQFLCSGTSSPVDVIVTSPVVSHIENVGDSLYAVPSDGVGYQWFFNGNPIPGATSPWYIGQESGNYTFQFTDENGCISNSYTLEFTYSGGNVGLLENSTFSLLELYPNPGRGQFSVRGVLPSNVDVHIAVTDMLGRTLMPDILLNVTEQFTQEFDISEFANGVYFVRIRVNDQLLTVRYIKS